MHMLRNEDNANYRATMKNTLEFDPEILKRFVNFMNNPDEETAVAQFGKGDKYFGIATMLATLPGLPMFGHGQVEGYAEKYGMEYRRAYWDEEPDPALVERHERQIFPLLHRRHLFAEVEHFLLYDVVAPEGHVNGTSLPTRTGRARTSGHWSSITTATPPPAAGCAPPSASWPAPARATAGPWSGALWAKAWGCATSPGCTISFAITSPAWNTSAAARDRKSVV